MKLLIHILLITLLIISLQGSTQTIWTGTKITFTKANGADWTKEENQDRITDNVWLTRGDSKSLFNIAKELSYDGSCGEGAYPTDTEWAFGMTKSKDSLTFATLDQTHGCSNTLSILNKDMVLHLISEDIYIDIKFTSYSSGGNGGKGGFTYERSTSAPLNIYSNIVMPNLQIRDNGIVKIVNFPEIASIAIFNANGKIMTTSTDSIIYISSYPSGLYFIKIEGKTLKFLKQ